MQLNPAGFARAVRLVECGRDAARIAFDVELSDGSRVPAFIERYGEGAFRLRLGPQKMPDYALVIATGGPIQGEIGESGSVRTSAGATTLILEQNPLRVVLERAAAGDHGERFEVCRVRLDHRRAFSGLDAPARVRPRRRSVDCRFLTVFRRARVRPR